MYTGSFWADLKNLSSMDTKKQWKKYASTGVFRDNATPSDEMF